jgi:hypothetical protein
LPCPRLGMICKLAARVWPLAGLHEDSGSCGEPAVSPLLSL